MLSLTNMFNAQTYLNIDSLNIVVDPWITNGIYQNSWVLDPKVNLEKCIESLKQSNICLISHIHEDHFDLNAIKHLSSDCTIMLPDMWPNNIVAKRKLKGRDVKFLEIDRQHKLDHNTYITFFGPMNGEGHLAGKKESDESDDIILDTGIIIKHKEVKIVLLCDNFPWNSCHLKEEVLNTIVDCDLLAVPFNSFADDYPICFDNYSKKQKLEISKKRNKARLSAIVKFCNKIKPRNVIPFSSDFFIKGPRSLEFDECHPASYKCRKLFSKKLNNEWGGSVIPISQNQEMFFGEDGSLSVTGVYEDSDFSEICKKLYSEKSNVECEKVDILAIEKLIKDSALNMFDKMQKLNLKSDWNFQIAVKDKGVIFNINPETKLISNKTCNRPFIRCNIDSGHLYKILTFDIHWDNERISYNLSWERSIDQYEPNINKAINFFHTSMKNKKVSL